MSKVLKKVLVSAVKETSSYVELFLNKNEPSGKIQYLNSRGRLITLLSDSNIDEEDIVLVDDPSKLPEAVGKVRVLKTGKTYIITNNIDLLGDRLEANGICNLFGLSSETSFLTSTGLPEGVPLITSNYTLVVERISFRDVHTCFSIDGNTNLVALDWKAVNFINIPNVGVINNCDNFIFDTGALLGSQGLRFTGTIGTIGLNNSLFRGIGTAGNIIELDANCVITRRFRIIYSSIIAFSSTVGINVNASATIPTESYILDTINFSGGGTYTSGVVYTDNKTRFVNSKGIENTAEIGNYFMTNNATATTISTVDTPVKALGTTTANTINQKFNHSDNRLTYVGALIRDFQVTATVSLTSGNNNLIGVYVAKNGVVIPSSEMYSTTSSGGKAESITCQTILELNENDYVEIWVENSTGTTDITVEYLNVITKSLN